jgi:VWFA-related protein
MSRTSPWPALIAFFLVTPLFAQFAERVDVSAVEVPVVVRDAKGNVPPGLTPRDFQLLEDGKPQEIIGVAYPTPTVSSTATIAPVPSAPQPEPEKRWQIVIYIQQSLSSSHGLSDALKSLVPRAAELTALGDVEIVGDEGSAPHVIAPPTHDAEQLRKTLLDLVPKIRGTEEINRMRRQFLAEVRSPTDTSTASSDSPSVLPPKYAQHGLATARIEALMVRHRQDELLTWTARYQEPGRKHALLFVTGGFDTEPVDFYHATDGSTDMDLRALSATKHQIEVARATASAGWTIISFSPFWMENAASPAFDVSNPGHDRMTAFLSNPASAIDTPSGIALHPLDPLRTLAEETGGSVEVDAAKLTKDIDQLANRLVLTYQMRRLRDGRAHTIVVKALRPGLTVRVQRVVVTGTSEALSIARAMMLAGDEGEHGELTVRCSVKPLDTKGKNINSQLEAQVSLAPIDAVRAGLTAGSLRFSVAVRVKDAPPVTFSKRMEPLDLAKQGNWQIDFQVQHSPGAAIGIVAEELSTGAWGGTKCGDATTAKAAPHPAPPPAAAASELTPAAPNGHWLPIAEAMAEAQKRQSLILLDLRSSSANADDGRSSRWLADAEAAPSSGRAMQRMALAWADERTDLKSLPDLAQVRGSKRQFFVLDPWGGVVAQPEEGYGDFVKFAYSLNALRQQTPQFIQAAMARRQGNLSQSLLIWADGLLYPRREVMVGNVAFEVSAPDDTARVELYLDERRVAELTRRPFNAKVNLGPTPHVHTLRAVAFDAKEQRIGEEHVMINDRVVTLAVNIVEPASDVVQTKTTVKVKPRVPEGARLAGVDLFWNESKVATMTEPPFRHELSLPSPAAPGFIRAVVRTADGAMAEDVKMINSGGVSEQVRSMPSASMPSSPIVAAISRGIERAGLRGQGRRAAGFGACAKGKGRSRFHRPGTRHVRKYASGDD